MSAAESGLGSGTGRASLPVEIETVACALCGEDAPRPLVRSRDLRYLTTPRDEFQLVECSRCGLRYLNPRPTERALEAFYPESYYSHRPRDAARGRGIIRRIYPSRAEKIIREKVARSLRLLPPAGRFIEYGPSTGQFLLAMCSRGFDGVGIERSGSMVRHIRVDLGLPCFAPAEFNGAEHGRVHLVVLWNVLEHLRDPAGFLQWAAGMLQPGGSILLSVPNAAALERSLFFRGESCEDIPRHLYAYTPGTIRRLLEREGYEEIRIHHATRASISELQERTERAIHALPGGRRAKRLLYGLLLLPLFWIGDRAVAILGRGHTMVVSARRP